MDIKPNEMIRLMQLGKTEKLITSKSIWLCTGCNTCLEKCPNNIQIPSLIVELRRKAFENQNAAVDEDMTTFYKAFQESVYQHGRVHELDLILAHKKQTKKYKQDLRLGVDMLFKGKLKLTPPSNGNIEEIRKIFELAKEQ